MDTHIFTWRASQIYSQLLNHKNKDRLINLGLQITDKSLVSS